LLAVDLVVQEETLVVVVQADFYPVQPIYIAELFIQLWLVAVVQVLEM
jgi:hypothetical protein